MIVQMTTLLPIVPKFMGNNEGCVLHFSTTENFGKHWANQIYQRVKHFNQSNLYLVSFPCLGYIGT